MNYLGEYKETIDQLSSPEKLCIHQSKNKNQIQLNLH